MPSFDVVSEINWVEMQNAVDQTMRELGTRFDFKGSNSSAVLQQKEKTVELIADDSFKVDQVFDILNTKMGKRNLDVRCVSRADVEAIAGGRSRQILKVHEGIDQTLARSIVKIIKNSKLKLQASIQGDRVRINGAKKDALQAAIQTLKDDIKEVPLQFINFRD